MSNPNWRGDHNARRRNSELEYGSEEDDTMTLEAYRRARAAEEARRQRIEKSRATRRRRDGK